LFVAVSTQLPPQAAPPLRHVQVPLAQPWPTAQTVPHMPQLEASVSVLVHCPEQLDNPPWQLHMPPAQV
jgi:hypothetical protein